jgi:hypothetical protein
LNAPVSLNTFLNIAMLPAKASETSVANRLVMGYTSDRHWGRDEGCFMNQMFWVIVPLVVAGLATAAWQNPSFYASFFGKWIIRIGLAIWAIGTVWNASLSHAIRSMLHAEPPLSLEAIDRLRAACEVPGEWWMILIFAGVYNIFLMALTHAKMKHEAQKS